MSGGRRDAGRGARVTETGEEPSPPSPRAAGPLRETESEVPGVLGHPFPPEVPGRLALSPCVPPSLAKLGGHCHPARGGQDSVFWCLKGLVEWTLVFPLPLYPAARRGEAGGAGSRGSRGSTLTWAWRSAGSLGRRGLSWAHAPPGGSAFAHGHLRFPRNSRAAGPPRLPPPWALEPPAPRFLHAAVLCGSRFLDNEPLTARSAASVTRRDPSFPFPRALALPTRAIPDRRDAEGIGRLVPVRGDRLARLTVCTVLAQTGAPHGPRTLVSLCGPPPAPLKGNLVLALAVGPGLPSH